MKNQNLVKVTTCMATLCVASGIAMAQQTTTNDPTTRTNATTASQPATSTTQTSTTTPTTQTTDVVARTSTLVGTKVENQQGQCLGRISDIVVDMKNQKVSYCILNVKHGFFGKTRYIPVPIAAFKTGTDGNYVILNASKANLASARGYANGQWPTTVSAWGAEPEQTVELPPVEVFAPEISPVIPIVKNYYGDPTWGAMPIPMTASQAIDVISEGVSTGFPVR